MQNSPWLYIARFAALAATQILVLNYIQFGGYLNPYIYILFILMLPLRTPPLVMILAGFALGFTIDIYTGVMGLHTAATLFVAFYRNRIMRMVIGIREEDFSGTPGVRDLGSWRFFYYAGGVTLVHHLILFLLEAFSFSFLFDTLLRVVFNGMVSLMFMLVTLILFERRKHE